MRTEKFRARYGPWAVVTGATDGIGRAFACELARLGLSVVLVARREQHLKGLAEVLAATHQAGTRIIACDLSTEAGVADVERETSELDAGLLIAAAGFGTSGNFLDADSMEEQSMLAVNCHAPMRLCRTLGRRFIERGRGGIVLFGSIVAWQGVPRSAHYAATKAYAQTLAEGLHAELAPLGIDVLSCAPGPVRSGFAARADMRMEMAMPPEPVATAALRALGRRTTVVPGAFSKLLTYSLLPLPRWVRTRILAQVMHGMTKHQTTAKRGEAG